METAVQPLLVWGLALLGVAMVPLPASVVPGGGYVAAPLFDVGWGLSWLRAHVQLLRYDGGAIADGMVAMARWPTVVETLVAGWSADNTGSREDPTFSSTPPTPGPGSASAPRGPTAPRPPARR